MFIPTLLGLLACGAASLKTSDSGAAVDSATPDGSDDSADASDDSAADDSAAPDEASRCEVGAHTMQCEHHSETLWTGFSGLMPREVHWQVPLGSPPAEGWPAVMLFQGSLFSAETFWWVLDTDVLGYWNQGQVTRTLLDNGFAVITPEAHAGGATAWDTNIPPMSLAWELAEDHVFMLDIFDAMDAGTFGDLNPARLYAGGISSGGYMSSRVALEYPERFSAIAIHSGSYATCTNVLCDIPDDLPASHAPTLFLHGTADVVVPMYTAVAYKDALDALGVPTDMVTEEGTGHAWIDAAPTAMLGWFEAY